MSQKLASVPKCVGIIMDGNRRYAKERGLPALEGHRAGGEKLKEVVGWARELGIEHIIFFTFSTENWNRSPEEVSYLLSLIGEYLQNELDYFHKEGGVLHCVGEMSRFSPELQSVLKQAEEKTARNAGPHVYFALNYGGRQEILSAVKKIISLVPKPEEVTEEYFARHLQTGLMPDPDMLIRTSGEQRLSGFLPWQAVYSELFFTPTFWPALTKEEFTAMVEAYAERQRRFGV